MIADLDVTIQPIYGRQEGAELAYNPHKPGRPSHAYHTVFLRAMRMALDGGSVFGKGARRRAWLGKPVAGAGSAGGAPTPRLVGGGGHGGPPLSRGIGFGGDANFGIERMTSECESGEQNYVPATAKQGRGPDRAADPQDS